MKGFSISRAAATENKYTTLDGDVAIGLCVVYMTCKRELVGTHEFKP